MLIWQCHECQHVVLVRLQDLHGLRKLVLELFDARRNCALAAFCVGCAKMVRMIAATMDCC